LHCWGLVPPVTVALREIGVPRGWGETGLALRAVIVGGSGAVIVKVVPPLLSGASVVFPLLRAQRPSW
jgi:hypothetical protein